MTPSFAAEPPQPGTAWPVALALLILVALYFPYQQERIRSGARSGDLLAPMPRMYILRLELRRTGERWWSLIGLWGYTKVVYLTVCILIVSLLESSWISWLMIFAAYLVVMAVSVYQTIAFRLGLMPSEWSWLARQQRAYERAQRTA